MPQMEIRPASRGDMSGIAEISRGTWEGSDYLEEKAGRWIEDGSLFVGVSEGRMVGTFRISILPQGVCWLEALRIHPDLRGMGYGRLLASEVFALGQEYLRRGEASCMEFSTYVNNVESRHISESQGFRVVSGYYLLYKENPERRIEIRPREVEWDAEDAQAGSVVTSATAWMGSTSSNAVELTVDTVTPAP